MKLRIAIALVTILSVQLSSLPSSIAEDMKSKCRSVINAKRNKVPDLEDEKLIYIACALDAEKGDAEAQYYVGIYFITLRHPDEKEGLKWIKLSADSGYSKAQAYWGNYHEYNKDVNRALLWYRKAAEKDDIFALLRLAEIYYQGLGTSVDGAQAVYWYERLANLNILNAMRMLVKIYSDGMVGVPADKERALYWETRLSKYKKHNRVSGGG